MQQWSQFTLRAFLSAHVRQEDVNWMNSKFDIHDVGTGAARFVSYRKKKIPLLQ